MCSRFAQEPFGFVERLVGRDGRVALPAAAAERLRMRFTFPSRVVAEMLQPTGHMPQIVGAFWISHGRASKRYCVEVSAPTGQSSITLPLNAPRYGSSSNVAITDCAPRLSATSCKSSDTDSLKRVQR